MIRKRVLPMPDNTSQTTMELPGDATTADAGVPPEPGRHIFKSCAKCRRQKLSCSGGRPCRRCHFSGETCIYEKRSPRRRNVKHTTPNKPPGIAASQPQQLEDLSAQVQRLQAIVEDRRRGTTPSVPITSAPTPASTSNAERVSPFSSTTRDWQVLSPDDLEIPITAVHVMTFPSRRGEPQRNFLGWTPSNQSKWYREENKTSSVIERSLLSETEAQRLFGNFMQYCNIATPVFDPVIDTFESVADQYPLAMTVVLYLAARQEAEDGDKGAHLSKTLEMEAKRVVGDTLFANPCSVDSVVAVLLLAVHSEKGWFSIGHTHQMSLDLGLHNSIRQVISNPDGVSRYDYHCARIYLYVVYFERILAHGTNRGPRCATTGSEDLDHLVANRYSHPSDLLFAGGLELFDASAQLRYVTSLPTLDRLEAYRDSWFVRWDTQFQKQCVYPSSLQRVRLRVQMLFAKTWQLGIVLSRQLQLGSPSNVEFEHLLDEITSTNHDLYTCIAGNDAYKRFVPWAPTSEVLFLTFMVVIGRKVLSLKPTSAQKDQFREASTQIAHLLRKHPCQHFSQLVEDLVRSADETDSNGEEERHGEALLPTGETFEAQLDEIFGEWAGAWTSMTEHATATTIEP